MSAAIQSGMHPDAETLTAFAELLLPAAEREPILAHMATCKRCREVVFLAQQAAVEEEPVLPVVEQDATRVRRASWFKGWRWAWIPAAAFAGFVGIAVVQHFRHATPETQMAGNTAGNATQTDSRRRAESAKAELPSPVPPPPTQQAAPSKSFGTLAAKDTAQLRAGNGAIGQLDEKKSSEQKNLALGYAASGIVLTPGVAGGSIHGTMAARANTTPYGGPAALNQFQQQNMAVQQNVLPQSPALQAGAAPADAANANAAQAGKANEMAVAEAAQQVPTETVTVKTEAQKETANPTISAQLREIPMTGVNSKVSSANVAGFAKAIKTPLPNGHGVLSQATQADRSIALDTEGSLFLSEDSGKHWQPIQTQWTGHALLVRVRPVAAQSDKLQGLQTLRFELVTDKLQTWFSVDGKNWTAQVVPLN